MLTTSRISVALVIVLAFAMPALADVDGEWEGTGTGCVLSPGSGKLVYIKAFQTWECSVYNGELYGEWSDELGNNGYFEGYEVESKDVCWETYEGRWYWMSGGWSIDMGDVTIKFHKTNETCYGDWWYDFRPMANSGTITGIKVN
jgi:ribosome modulation factor